jgi:uncharacterized membrane protein
MTQKLSKGLYMGWIIGGEVASMLFLIIGLVFLITAGVMAAVSNGDMNSLDWGLLGTGIFFFVLAMIFGFIAAIFGYVLLYKAWQAIQDGQPQTTPGKAVGFLFIPFFNLYWIFVAYWGWAKDYNKYAVERGYQLPVVPEGLFLAYPIVTLCSALPYVGSLAGLALVVIFIIICIQMIDAVNALYTARQAKVEVTTVR